MRPGWSSLIPPPSQANHFAQANAMDVQPDTYDEPTTIVEPEFLVEPETVVETETIEEEETLASTFKAIPPARSSTRGAAKRPAAHDEDLGAAGVGRQAGRKRFKKASEARALEI